MNNKPVAWTDKRQLSRPYPHSDAMTMWVNAYPEQGIDIPLYINPHPDNLGLAESIIKQQQLKIDNLLENNARLDAEIEVLKSHPVKELTDEEANDCYKEAWKLADDATGNCRSYTHMFQLLFNREFAKAILKKAQEQ